MCDTTLIWKLCLKSVLTKKILSYIFSGEVKYVLLGDYILNRTDEESDPTVIKVVDIIVPESYKSSYKYDDIALLRLEYNVPFSQYIRPACLAETYDDAAAGKAIASGWGSTDNDEEGSDTLLKVTLELYSREECFRLYEPFSRLQYLRRGILHAQQLCAGSHTLRRDTCQVNRHDNFS